MRLELKNIIKTFGTEVTAVDNVSLTVSDGEFLTLLGPSGCGKTTLLRIIAGLESPDSGQIKIDGKDVTDLPPARRDVAMVFQSYALYPHMTVYDNIAVSLKLKKIAKEKIREKVDTATDTLDITGLLKRLPKELSGGQRQRVALARALVREPKLFLLDEPLSNLDAVLREKTRAELKMLFSQVGGTVVYVTHDQTEAMSMSKNIAVIKDGRIHQLGTPREIYTKPAGRFVAGFVGSPSMSFFEATVNEGLLIADNLEFDISGQDTGVLDKVIAGLRPEDIKLEESQFDGINTAHVELVEPFGSYEVATLKSGYVILKALIPPETVKQDSAVKITPEKIHLFDSESGKAI